MSARRRTPPAHLAHPSPSPADALVPPRQRLPRTGQPRRIMQVNHGGDRALRPRQGPRSTLDVRAYKRLPIDVHITTNPNPSRLDAAVATSQSSSPARDCAALGRPSTQRSAPSSSPRPGEPAAASSTHGNAVNASLSDSGRRHRHYCHQLRRTSLR